MFWIKCPGDAHENPYIDYCLWCAPFWGKIPRCSCGSEKPMKVGNKFITCLDCRRRYVNPQYHKEG